MDDGDSLWSHNWFEKVTCVPILSQQTSTVKLITCGTFSDNSWVWIIDRGHRVHLGFNGGLQKTLGLFFCSVFKYFSVFPVILLAN